MKKTLYMFPACAALVAASVMLTSQPAFALPSCEQEVSIRCNGHSVQNRGRLDIYYNSYEECVAEETFYQCGGDWPYGSLNGRAEDSPA